MGIRITGGEGVRRKITLVKHEMTQRVELWLETAGQVVEKTARLYAPIDTGDLENAITHDKTSTKTMSVFVDPDKLDLESRDGFDYSVEMHDGFYKLGPLSQKKARANGHEVGPKYLERALKDNEDMLRKQAEEILRELSKV